MNKKARKETLLKGRTILQILPALETGGVETTTLEVGSALIKTGARAFVASSGGKMESNFLASGGTAFHLPLHRKTPWHLLKNTFSLVRLIKREKVDLVHARSRFPAWSAFWAARFCRVPFITTFHGTYNFKNKVKKFYNSIMTRGDIIIANSRFTAQHMEKIYHVGPQHIRIIPRGVDTDCFDPKNFNEETRQKQLISWGIDPSHNIPVLFLPGRLTSWKGQAIFLKALTYLSELHFVAVLAGDDQGRTYYKHTLEKFIQKEKLEKCVKIVGHCDNMPQALYAATCMISASTDPEAFGRVMIEALAMERPVIATEHGGALEIIEPGETGFLVPPSDSYALAKAIERLLLLTDFERHEMGKKGRTYIQKHYTTKLLQQATLGVYLDVLAKG